MLRSQKCNVTNHGFAHIILENGKFEFLKLILSLKTMINRIFFFEPFPPMKREADFSVVVYGNYQYLHQAASRFMGGNAVMAVKFNCFWY